MTREIGRTLLCAAACCLIGSAGGIAIGRLLWYTSGPDWLVAVFLGACGLLLGGLVAPRLDRLLWRRN